MGGWRLFDSVHLQPRGGALDNMVDFIFDHAPDRRKEPDMDILQRLAKEIREK